MSNSDTMMLERFNRIVPKAAANLHKGQCGKIGIVGGSSRYTGAPYFAGISALKLGGDLVSIFCTADAAIPIKSYSPELMVSGSMELQQINASNGHSLVIGPGLGRENAYQASLILTEFLDKLPIVLDGDGLWMLVQYPEIVKQTHFVHNLILTPNAMEFHRLWNEFMQTTAPSLDHDGSEQSLQDTKALAKKIGAIIVRKGTVDIIASPEESLVCSEEGSPRRCGGQGDVLAGSIGLFASWGVPKKDILAGIYGGCVVTRRLAKKTFEELGYSMSTTDLIANIPYLMHVKDTNCPNPFHIYLQSQTHN